MSTPRVFCLVLLALVACIPAAIATAQTVDVATSITDSPDPLTLGTGNITYTITIRNHSVNTMASGVSATVTIPGSSVLVVASASGGGTCGAESGGTFACTWASLAANASATVGVTVTPTAGGLLTLSASADATELDSDSSNDADSEITVVNAAIDLRVASISDSPDPITLGLGDVNYTVVVGNESTSKATNAVLTVTLPAASTLVSAAASDGGNCGPASGGVLTCPWNGDFAAGALRTATIRVTPGSGDVNELSASIAADQPDPDGSDDTRTESTVVNAAIDLRVSVTDSPDPVTLNQGNVTYAITLTNDSTTAVSNPVMTVSIPPSAVFITMSSTTGTCGESGGTVTCSWSGLLAAGATRTVSILVTPTAAGTMTLSASVAGDQSDPEPADNTHTEATTVLPAPAPHLTIVKEALRADGITPISGSVVPGEFIVYRLTVTNDGDAPAEVVEITDVMPAEVSYQSASAAAHWAIVEASGTVTATLTGPLAAGASRTFSILVRVN